MPWAHRVLIVGAEGRLLDDLRATFGFMATDAIFCSGVFDVRRVIRDERFCYLVIDPLGSVFRSPEGEDLLDDLRRFDGMAIIVNGGSEGKAMSVFNAVRRKLHAAGCYDHRECGRSRDRAGSGVYASATAPVMSVLIDGVRINKRNGFLIDGKRGSTPDSRFIGLLKLADRHEVSPKQWNEPDHLQIENSANLYRLPDDLVEIVPEGFQLVQIDTGKFRLHPDANVATDWERIAEHPTRHIAEFARERLRRRSSP